MHAGQTHFPKKLTKHKKEQIIICNADFQYTVEPAIKEIYIEQKSVSSDNLFQVPPKYIYI